MALYKRNINNPFLFICRSAPVQQLLISTSFDEVKVPEHQLSDSLIQQNGKKVKNNDIWTKEQRTYIKRDYDVLHPASRVHYLFGINVSPEKKIQRVKMPVAGTIGYHLRPVKNEIALYDLGIQIL